MGGGAVGGTSQACARKRRPRRAGSLAPTRRGSINHETRRPWGRRCDAPQRRATAFPSSATNPAPRSSGPSTDSSSSSEQHGSDPLQVRPSLGSAFVVGRGMWFGHVSTGTVLDSSWLVGATCSTSSAAVQRVQVAPGLFLAHPDEMVEPVQPVQPPPAHPAISAITASGNRRGTRSADIGRQTAPGSCLIRRRSTSRVPSGRQVTTSWLAGTQRGGVRSRSRHPTCAQEAPALWPEVGAQPPGS